MNFKVVEDPILGRIEYRRRAGQKNIRITCRPNRIKVSLPATTSYQRAARFLAQKQSWLLKHRQVDDDFVDGMHIGRCHQLVIDSSLVSNQIRDGQIRVNGQNEKLRSTILKALKQEAQQLLPDRVNQIIQDTGWPAPTAIRIRHMESRWGCCHQRRRTICLNSLLVQLPDQLVDYVLIHELGHLQQFNHSRAYWQLIASQMPNWQTLRAELRGHQLVIVDSAKNF